MADPTSRSQRTRQSGWSWSLLMFSLVIFTATIVSYLGILFGYIPLLNQQIGSLDDRTAQVSRTISPDDQKNLAEFYSQLVNSRELLRGHTLGSSVFGLLERNTNQTVSLASLRLNIEENRAEIEAIAQNYESAIQQTEAFRRMPETRSISIGTMQASEQGGIRFGMSIEFTPTALRAQ